MITFRLDGSPSNGSLPQIKVTLGPTFRLDDGYLTASLPHTDVTLSLLTVCICMFMYFRTHVLQNMCREQLWVSLFRKQWLYFKRVPSLGWPAMELWASAFSSAGIFPEFQDQTQILMSH